MAPWIISHFPTHRIYTEAYGGGASVLMRKPPCYAEVYNDLDGEIVNLFRVMQSEEDSARLKKIMRSTPYARAEFELSYEPTEDRVEAARRLIIRSFMGFGSNAHNKKTKTGFRANSNRSGTTPAHDWANYPEAMAFMTERLRGVMIESRPALELLKQQDGPETLHYVDPPYPLSTRSDQGRDYNHEMTDEDHIELAGVLNSLRGMVVLSGYKCRLFDEVLYPRWDVSIKKTFADGARPRVEVLWLNRAAAKSRKSLFTKM